MKKLFILLLIWLGLTIQLSIKNLNYKEAEKFNIHWRAFLVYHNSIGGCMIGAYYSNPNYNFIPIYRRCFDYAINEKEIYLSKWLPKNE